MDPLREKKLEEFKTKALEEQRQYLIALIEPLSEKSATYSRLLPKIRTTDKSSFLIRIMETIETVTDKIQVKKKQIEQSSFEKQQENLKKILQRETLESEEDKKSLIELERLLDQL